MCEFICTTNCRHVQDRACCVWPRWIVNLHGTNTFAQVGLVSSHSNTLEYHQYMLRAWRSRRVVAGHVAAVESIKHGISPHHQRPESIRRVSNTSVEANSHALRSRIRVCFCSGSTAAHMPAICDLFFAADPPLAATRSRTMTILGVQLGTQITNQGNPTLKSDKMDLVSTKARSGKYYL